MRIAILGSGAMGSVFGGRLALAGHDVTLVDVWREHMTAVADHGLTMSSSAGDTLVAHPRAISDGSELGPVDAVIVLAKGYAVRDAGESIRQAVGPDTLIAPLMNGIGHDRLLGEMFGAHRVVPGTTLVGAEIVAAGHTRMSDMTSAGDALSHFGRPRGASEIPETVRRLAEVLTDAQLPTEAIEDADTVIWTKLTLAASMGPLCAVLRRTLKDIWANDDARAVLRTLFDEIVTVAAADGVELDRESVWSENHARIFPATGHDYSSMAWDVMKGRRTEIDSFSLEVARRAREHGLAAPVSEAIGRMIKALEEPSGRDDG
jgi:2-dehydropantoate 2-reductase